MCACVSLTGHHYCETPSISSRFHIAIWVLCPREICVWQSRITEQRKQDGGMITPLWWRNDKPLSFPFLSLFRFRFLSCIKGAWCLWREWSQRPLPHKDPAGTSAFSFNSYLPHFGSFPWQRLPRERAGARSPAKPSLVLDRCLRQKKKGIEKETLLVRGAMLVLRLCAFF